MQHWFSYPGFNPIAFHLGPISVHWYGLSYLFGFIMVFVWMNRPAGRARLGLTADGIQDFLVYALVGVLVGGRTGFVISDIITYHNVVSTYLAHPINFIAVWNGGMAFHGALIGVILAGILFLRKHRPLTFEILGDEVVMLLPLGLITTRFVNFINDELVGNICNPDHPWCMNFPNYPGPRYPSQIFEAILDAAALPVLFFVYKQRPPDGVVLWTWFICYAIARSVADIWREPGFTILGLSGGQLLGIPMVIAGALLIYRAYRVNRRTTVLGAA
jgi:phosphatidylglycerol:prolipoprotein diacylglycerol transferase